MCLLDILDPHRSKYYYREELIPVREHRGHHHQHYRTEGRRISMPTYVSYDYPRRSSRAVYRSTLTGSPRFSTISYRSSAPVVVEERRSRRHY